MFFRIVAGLAALLPLVAFGQETKQPQPFDRHLEGKATITFDVVAKKSKVQIEATTAADSVLFDIRSPSGIGSATISPKEGQWPHKVVLRLRLKGLESLAISNGRVTLGASVSSHGDQGQRVYLKDGGQENPVEKGSTYWTRVKLVGGQKVPLKDGYFEVVLPEALLKDGPKTLTVSWIDFYRG